MVDQRSPFHMIIAKHRARLCQPCSDPAPNLANAASAIRKGRTPAQGHVFCPLLLPQFNTQRMHCPMKARLNQFQHYGRKVFLSFFWLRLCENTFASVFCPLLKPMIAHLREYAWSPNSWTKWKREHENVGHPPSSPRACIIGAFSESGWDTCFQGSC